MISFLLCTIASAKITLPKMSVLMINEMYTDEAVKQMEKMFDENKDKMMEQCKQLDGETRDICEATYKAIEGYYFSDGSNINSKLQKVSKKSDFLFFMSTTSKELSANFNELKSTMAVFVISMNMYDYSGSVLEKTQKAIHKLTKNMIKSSFKCDQKSVIRLSKLFKQKKSKALNINSHIILKGNIKDKVPYLSIGLTNVEFQDSPLNSETLYLAASSISSTSQPIQSKFLLVEEYSHKELANSDKVKVEQYGLVLIDVVEDESTNNFRISYKKSGWYIYKAYDFRFESSTYYSIPYSFANSASIIIFTFYIDINVDDTTLDNYGQINVTISKEGLEKTVPGMPGSKILDSKEVVIKTTGDWDKVQNKPTLILTTDDGVKVDKKDAVLDVDQQTRYSYKPKKSGPNIAMIVGIVVAVVVVVVIVVVVVVVVVLKRKKVSNS